jgi:hypothetical protein
MPGSMAGLATSLASSGRHTGITLGVAIAGTIIGPGLAGDGSGAHAVWWMVIGLGVGIVILGLLSTGRWAHASGDRAAAHFEQVERGPAPI